MGYYTNRLGQLATTYGLAGDNYEEKERQSHESALARGQQQANEQIGIESNKSQEARARITGQSQGEIAQTQANAQMRAAESAAQAVRDAARIRARGYNQGGAVYKHEHPTYMKYGQTGDSSLLAKGRK